jgi:hypothetical protein
MRFGKVEHSRSTVDDGRKPIERRLFGGLPPACLGCGVDDVWKVAIRKREAANISRVKSEGRIGGKMRALHREGRGVARQDRGASVEIELPIDIGEAFQQPAPEKAGAPCYENLLVSHLLPEWSGLVEDMVEVGGGQRLLCHRLGLVILADVEMV